MEITPVTIEVAFKNEKVESENGLGAFVLVVVAGIISSALFFSSLSFLDPFRKSRLIPMTEYAVENSEK